jgi:hypothetical protein
MTKIFVLSWTLPCSGEIDRPSFPFIDLYVPAPTPRLLCSEAALQFAENTTFMFLCRVNTGIVPKQGDEFQVPRGLHCTILGQRQNLEAPLLLFFFGLENSASAKNLHFLSVRKEAISLMRLVNFYSDK